MEQMLALVWLLAVLEMGYFHSVGALGIFLVHIEFFGCSYYHMYIFFSLLVQKLENKRNIILIIIALGLVSNSFLFSFCSSTLGLSSNFIYMLCILEVCYSGCISKKAPLYDFHISNMVVCSSIFGLS